MNTDIHHFDEKAKHWDDNPQHVERARHVAEGIRIQIPLATTMTALEYGCGTGLVSFHLQPDLQHVTLADTSPGMLDVLKEKIQTAHVTNMTPIKLNLVEDPLPEERFDVIYTVNTLHHIPEAETVLQHFYTLLKPGGCLCVADLDKEDGGFHGKGFSGHHGFDRNVLQQQLAAIGFSDIAVADCFTMKHVHDDGTTREFSIFLMVGKKL